MSLKKYHNTLDLELKLLGSTEKLPYEFGKEFVLIGRKYHLEIAGYNYYLDLLFYNMNLRCYCIVELKNTEFKPEYIGKLNFYLSAIDDKLKKCTDNQSIGILFCKTGDKVVVEYTLQDIDKPIGVVEYKALKQKGRKINLK